MSAGSLNIPLHCIVLPVSIGSLLTRDESYKQYTFCDMSAISLLDAGPDLPKKDCLMTPLLPKKIPHKVML